MKSEERAPRDSCLGKSHGGGEERTFQIEGTAGEKTLRLVHTEWG